MKKSPWLQEPLDIKGKLISFYQLKTNQKESHDTLWQKFFFLS